MTFSLLLRKGKEIKAKGFDPLSRDATSCVSFEVMNCIRGKTKHIWHCA